MNPTVPESLSTPPGEGRRWSDRPGRIPALTFARFLTTTPELDEVARFLVGLLAWPIGAVGVFVVRDHGDSIETIARYDEQLDAELPDGCDDWAEQELRDVVTAVAAGHPALWTDHDFPGCRPMAAWPLGASTGKGEVLVVVLGAPLPAKVVTERFVGVADVLAVYLAGVMSLPATTSVDGSVRLSPRQARVLSLLQEDLTMQQIAVRVGFSESTVRMDSLSIYRTLGVHDRRQAVLTGLELGLIAAPRSPSR
jgi:DNA-binding CsgD family transcriptional regulator